MSNRVSSKKIVTMEAIQYKILFIRGQKVMLDKDLAALYQVKPIALRQQVRRNTHRFPDDFCFQLTREEVKALVSQFVIPSEQVLGGYLPLAFTEQGVAMLSSVLKSKMAVLVNIQIMRVFVKLKEMLISHKDLAQKIEDLERKFQDHDKKFVLVFEAIRQLLKESAKPKKTKESIGFRVYQ